MKAKHLKFSLAELTNHFSTLLSKFEKLGEKGMVTYFKNKKVENAL